MEVTEQWECSVSHCLGQGEKVKRGRKDGLTSSDSIFQGCVYCLGISTLFL